MSATETKPLELTLYQNGGSGWTPIKKGESWPAEWLRAATVNGDRLSINLDSSNIGNATNIKITVEGLGCNTVNLFENTPFTDEEIKAFDERFNGAAVIDLGENIEPQSTIKEIEEIYAQACTAVGSNPRKNIIFLAPQEDGETYASKIKNNVLPNIDGSTVAEMLRANLTRNIDSSLSEPQY